MYCNCIIELLLYYTVAAVSKLVNDLYKPSLVGQREGEKVGGRLVYLRKEHLSWWTLLNNIAVMWANLDRLLSSGGLIEQPPLVCFPIWALVGTSILPLRLFSEKSSCLIYWICFSMFAYLLSGDAMLHKLCRVLLVSDIGGERLMWDRVLRVSRQCSETSMSLCRLWNMCCRQERI